MAARTALDRRSPSEDRVGRGPQVAGRSPEPVDVGEHRQAGGPTGGVAAGHGGRREQPVPAERPGRDHPDPAAAAALVVGALPFWDVLRRRPQAQAALRGVNAAVVGLLLAALYDPVWTSGIRTPADFALAAAALLLLAAWKLPPWLVVIVTALAGVGLAAAGY